MKRERLTRYHQAIAKWKNECNQIDRIGVLCGDKPWDMAARNANSLIYLSLGLEGRKKHTRNFPHTIVENKTTQEIGEELELTFIRPRNVTFDRFLLLTRKQQREETMQQFHSSLRSLAEHCQLAHLEDELLRDIFTANMVDHEIQKELSKTTLNPEKALELAVSIELEFRSQLAIHSKQLSDPHQNAFIGRKEMISEYRAQGSADPIEQQNSEDHIEGTTSQNTATTETHPTTSETVDKHGTSTIKQNARQ